MSELVKELRNYAETYKTQTYHQSEASLFARAAGEIERLQTKAALWDALIADTNATPCCYPCLRDDLEDWKQDHPVA